MCDLAICFQSRVIDARFDSTCSETGMAPMILCVVIPIPDKDGWRAKMCWFLLHSVYINRTRMPFAVITRWSKLGGKPVIVSSGRTWLILSWLKFKRRIFFASVGITSGDYALFLLWGNLHPSFYFVWHLHDFISCLSIMYSLHMDI